MTLPTTEVIVNGFLVSDALIDSGSQLTLIDSRVYSVVAPNSELTPPARLISASGHQLNAIGKCTLSVSTDNGQTVCRETEFTVVHNLVLGWDFLSSNSVIMNCSSERSAKLKIRIKKPVSVPPRSAMCLSVKVDQPLSCDAEYVFVGQQSNEMEICDSLFTPFSETEIPVYIRNRSERVITVHRRSVIGYVERVEHVESRAPEPADRDAAAVEVNAVSADVSRFVGKSTDDVSDAHGADWEQRLQGVVFSLNNEVCGTLGYSPFFLYLLRHPHSSLSRLAKAPKNQYSDNFVHEHLRLLSSTLQRAQARQAEESKRYKRQYDRRYRVRECIYKSGDRLWVKNFQARSKMDDPWCGPYVVVSIVGRRHVDYMDNRGVVRRTHMKNTKLVSERPV